MLRWLAPVRVETDLLGRIVWDSLSGRVGRVLGVTARRGKPIMLAARMEDGERLTAEIKRFLVPESRLEPLLSTRLGPAPPVKETVRPESSLIGQDMIFLMIVRSGNSGFYPHPGRYRARAILHHGREKRLLVEVLRDENIPERTIPTSGIQDGVEVPVSGQFHAFCEVCPNDWDDDIMTAKELDEANAARESESYGEQTNEPSGEDEVSEGFAESFECPGCGREFPQGQTVCPYCDEDEAEPKAAPTAGPREKSEIPRQKGAEPTAVVVRRTSTIGRYDEWQATCPNPVRGPKECRRIYDPETVRCIGCGSKLRADFTLKRGYPEDLSPDKRLKLRVPFWMAHIELFCETCPRSYPMVSCPEHGTPMTGKHIRVRVMMPSRVLRAPLKAMNALSTWGYNHHWPGIFLVLFLDIVNVACWVPLKIIEFIGPRVGWTEYMWVRGDERQYPWSFYGTTPDRYH